MRKYHLFNHTSIHSRFLSIFIAISLILFLASFPLFMHLYDTFSALQQEKDQTKLNAASAQIADVVSGVNNIHQALSKDSRFIALRYVEADYASTQPHIRNQLQNSFSSLIFPFDLITDAAIQFDQNVAITNSTVFFEGYYTCYYPDFFCIDDLTYTEWIQLLSEEKSGFLSRHSVKTFDRQYDALIYHTKWTSNAYFYICIDIADIRQLLTQTADYYFTISTVDGQLLYSDLPNDLKNFQTISSTSSVGNLKISLHATNTVIFQKMMPLYTFFAIYICVYILLVIIIILGGTRVSTRPLLNIIRLLQQIKQETNVSAGTDSSAIGHQHLRKNMQISFEHISEYIIDTTRHLDEYQNTVQMQHKILQVRLMEKALYGHLFNSKELDQFHSCFPDFPEYYRLVYINLLTNLQDTPELYPAPLLLLQSFLQSELPNVYQQQLSDTELLLLIPEANFVAYRKTLDFLVDNINHEEPAYVIRCIASKTYQHSDSLHIAYKQIQDICAFTLPDRQTQIYTAEERLYTPLKATFTMTDLMTLYTSIIHGNQEGALSQLCAFFETLNIAKNTSLNKSFFEMLRTVLTCIKAEQPILLLDADIPVYNEFSNLSTQYNEFSAVIERFCTRISEKKLNEITPFVKEILQYIDIYYTDCNLCLTTLEIHFNCASSTIRKAFKKDMGITVSSYIEQKRMQLANLLLAQNDKKITEIAVMCGYCNPNSFYVAYRRIHGHAPTIYPQE